MPEPATHRYRNVIIIIITITIIIIIITIIIIVIIIIIGKNRPDRSEIHCNSEMNISLLVRVLSPLTKRYHTKQA